MPVGGVVYALVMPYLSGERKAEKRVANVAQNQTRMQLRAGGPQSLQMRKQQVQDTIKNIEAKQKAKKRVPLRVADNARGPENQAAHLLSFQRLWPACSVASLS